MYGGAERWLSARIALGGKTFEPKEKENLRGVGLAVNQRQILSTLRPPGLYASPSGVAVLVACLQCIKYGR
jgi:hypothetical protein